MKKIEPADLMLNAAYIIKGFFEHVIKDKLEATELLKGYGEIHVVWWLIQFAHDIENVWALSDKDPIGVWCYEVAEPFGRAIANRVNVHGEFPSVSVARQTAYEYAMEALGEDV